MYYTSYKQDEIYDNRQTAINKSRALAKEEFLNQVARVNVCYDDEDYPNIKSFADPKHEDIVLAYENYIKNRTIVYEVKLTKIDKVF